MIMNIIESNVNNDGLQFFQTDGICIEEYSQASKIKTDKQSLNLQKCKNSSEYLEYYSQFDIPKYSNFQKGIKAMKSFIFSIKNNYLLIKGHEEYFSKIFNEKLSKFISAFEIIFKNNSIIAREFVDSYIFSNLYEIIMKKLDSLYSNEQKDLKIKLEENINKYGILELNLDKSLMKCKFENIFNKLDNLKTFTTSFEKINSLIEINSNILEEARIEYENENNNKKFEIQGDLLISLWTYILSKYINIKNENKIFLEYLFFKYFRINKGYEKDDYIIINFIGSMELLQKELLNEENIIDKKPSTIAVKISSLV